MLLSILALFFDDSLFSGIFSFTLVYAILGGENWDNGSTIYNTK